MEVEESLAPAPFQEAADAAFWEFARSRPLDEYKELQMLRGSGWTKYMAQNAACTLIAILSRDGISLSTRTMLNPTVRMLDFYAYAREDDHNAVLEVFRKFLEEFWEGSLADRRHTSLFGAPWPRYEIKKGSGDADEQGN